MTPTNDEESISIYEPPFLAVCPCDENTTKHILYIKGVRTLSIEGPIQKNRRIKEPFKNTFWNTLKTVEKAIYYIYRLYSLVDFISLLLKVLRKVVDDFYTFLGWQQPSLPQNRSSFALNSSWMPFAHSEPKIEQTVVSCPFFSYLGIINVMSS